MYGGLLEEEPATPIQGLNHTKKHAGSHDATKHSQTAMGKTEAAALNHANEARLGNMFQILGSDMVIVRPNAQAEEGSVSHLNQNKLLSSSDFCSSDCVVLPSELEDLPHSEIVSLRSDSCLSISCCRVYREDALLLVLFLSNLVWTPLDELAVDLRCEELQVCHD